MQQLFTDLGIKNSFVCMSNSYRTMGFFRRGCPHCLVQGLWNFENLWCVCTEGGWASVNIL